MLVSIERVWPTGLVLIIDYAGTLFVVICELLHRDKLVFFASSFRRGYKQAVIRIDENNVHSSKPPYCCPMPFFPKINSFRLSCSLEIQLFRVENRRKNTIPLQCRYFSLLGFNDVLQFLPQLLITGAEARFFEIVHMATISVMAFIWGKIPVYTDGQPGFAEHTKKSQLAKIANITCISILHITF